MRRRVVLTQEQYLRRLAFLLVVSCLLIEYSTKGFLTDKALLLRQHVIQTNAYISDRLRYNEQVLSDNQRLKKEIMSTRQAFARLKFERSEHDFLRDENKHLRRLLGIKNVLNSPKFTRPIRVYNQAGNRSMRAVRPSGHVQVGMLALNEDGVVIGRVASLSQNSLHILLLNDKKSALPVVVSNKHVNAVAVGNGQGIDLVHLPIDSDVKAGDVVRTLQTHEDRVDYQTIGTVDSVQNSPDRTFLIAKLSQADILKSLQWLILI